MLELPGLIDVHVHMREPGATHKEDWASGTAAALAGGVTALLAMPNTRPPLTDAAALQQVGGAAAARARCDYGLFLGATEDNVGTAAGLAPRVAGLKLYLDNTYGPLKLQQMRLWLEHLKAWPAGRPVAAHAEGRSLGALLQVAGLAGRAVHICHVARRDEILLIRAAREAGQRVTCEVAPHHLFLCQEDAASLGGPGRSRVSPALGTRQDQQALWDNLDVVDCFATDHAPHTPQEKDGDDPPPGFPGLEAMLPLLLTAAHEGRLTLEEIVQRLVHNPRRIFGLPEQPETRVEVDPDARFELSAAQMHSRCGWTPYEGFRVRGRVRRVLLRGQEVLRDGEVLAQPGSGRQMGGAS
jgi:carbamoyl-phosphate synthase/aspartate carbamoyltransferase/dihydroorotase